MDPLAALMLADGRLPTGGHAHSGGLEAAVAGGLDAAEVPSFMVGRLRAATASEAHVAVAARRAAAAGDRALLDRLAAECEARCPSPPLRAASRRLGRQLLRTAAVVFGQAEILRRWPADGVSVPRPVAFGAVASAAGLGDAAAARALLYDDAVTVATAAVRLLPVDGAEAFRWVAELAPLVDELAAEAAAGSVAPEQLPAPWAPLIELGSLAHARAERSLFVT